MRLFLSFFIVVFLISCQDDVLVKPKAKLRLDYPQSDYKRLSSPCPFSFEVNTESVPIVKRNCWVNIAYPYMKGTVYMTYYPVRNNLDSLLYDAQKLTYDHSIKASNIIEQKRVDSINKVYGMFYMINGEAATPAQFYVTDSAKHFISGSVYFDSKPNYDSIYPAAMYLRNDMRKIMETIRWE